MKILVACEESQIVTKKFRELGHEAYSNDIQECSGGKPEWHIQDDTLSLLGDHWDMIIGFPPCTYLTVTGNAWFNIEKYGDKAIKRYKDRDEAKEFFMAIYNSKCDKVAIENPVGVMNTCFREPDQIIQPYHFGDPFEKRTCLWLKGLPPLQHTKLVEPPPRVFAKSGSGKSMAKWFADAWHLSPSERSKVRSKTFPGIANAMGDQWSNHINLFDIINEYS